MRKKFTEPDDWALWAYDVLRSNRGSIIVNQYRRWGDSNIANGMHHAVKLGLVVRPRGYRPDMQVFKLIQAEEVLADRLRTIRERVRRRKEKAIRKVAAEARIRSDQEWADKEHSSADANG